MQNFKDILDRAAADYGLSLTDSQLVAMDTYYRLLSEWNEKINLTAITKPQEVAVKHMIDSLSCYQDSMFNYPDTRVIDVGTGAGFPGIPLKIFQPSLQL
ncbi:MAG: 16S rRNA (guanine(527)-N(7))-methyltransferase RsmG, partial [Sporomusa sp.]